MQPTDILGLTWVADPRIAQRSHGRGRRLARRRGRERLPQRHLARALDGSSAAPVHLGREAGSCPALVARRGEARLRLEPGRGVKQLYVIVRGWGGGTSYRPRGGRRRGCLVAGRTAPRLLGPCPGPGVRGGGREAAATAAIHAAAVQARRRGLDRRSPHATSSRWPRTGRRRRRSSRTATTRIRTRPGRRTETRIAFASARHEDWDIELVRDVYSWTRKGASRTGSPASDALVRGSSLVAGRIADRLPLHPRAGSTTHATARSPWSTSRPATGACSRPRSTATALPTRRSASRSGTATRCSSRSRTAATTLYRVRADGADAPRAVVAASRG